MARQESNREDLLAEATALIHRAELRFNAIPESVVIGFRQDGCGSVYIGADFACHFNTRWQLRRAYVQGLLYKAETGQLVALTRQRTPTAVQLVRGDVEAAQADVLLRAWWAQLNALKNALLAGEYQLVGQSPEHHDVRMQMVTWLETVCSAPISVADSPHAR